MTDYNSSLIPIYTYSAEITVKNTSLTEIIKLKSELYTASSGSSKTIYYFMRGQDLDCLPTITYRTWSVTGSPDITGASYSGTRCGATPLDNITIIGKYSI